MMKSKLLRFLGLVIFIVILLHVDLAKIFSSFKSIQPLPFFLSAVILLSFHLSKSIRWQYILRSQSLPYNLFNSYLMYSAALYVGVITPGRVGDFIKALYLKKDGHSTGTALMTVFLDRIVDLFFLFLIAIPSFLWIQHSSNAEANIFGIVILISLMIIFVILLASKRVAIFFGEIFVKFIPSKYKPMFRNNYTDFYSSLHSLTLLNYLVIVFFTVTGWFIYFFLIDFFCTAAGLNIPFLHVIFFFVISSLASFIPISIAGIGTRDLALLYFFSQVGYSKETAISFSLIILLIYFLTTVFGLIAWLIKPVNW